MVYGRQTEWLEQVAESFFSLYGTDFDKFNQKLERVPRKFHENYDAKRGISMKAYVMTNAGWKKLGVFQNAGIVKEKLMGMDIDLDQVPGNEVKIKLEAAFRFWEIDQIGLTQDGQRMDQFEEVPLRSAINESGQDVAALLQNIDDQYAVQPAAGSQIELTFDNSAGKGEIYVLQGTGYYRHVREYAHEPQWKAIRGLRSLGKLSAHEFSRSLHGLFEDCTGSEMSRSGKQRLTVLSRFSQNFVPKYLRPMLIKHLL